MSREISNPSSSQSTPERDWKKIAEKRLHRLEDEEAHAARIAIEMETICASLRAVIENCRTMPVEAIRHQLVGLLPEVQPLPPDLAQRMREKNMGHLVDRHEAMTRANWAEFGYPEEA
jgi:hypothetical protein